MQENNIPTENHIEAVADKNLDRIVNLASLISDATAAFIYSSKEKMLSIYAKQLCVIELNKDTVSLFDTLCNEKKFIETNNANAQLPFKNHPEFINQHQVVYFASWPLVRNFGAETFSGILCVCNNKPSQLTAEQKEAISILGEQALGVIEGKSNAPKPGIKRLLEKKFASLSYYYNAFLDATDYGVILLNLKGGIKVFNSGAEKMLGFTAHETIDKKTIFSFHDNVELQRRIECSSNNPEDLFENYILKPKMGLASTDDWTFIRKDGRKIIVQLSITTIKNEQKEIIGYLAIAEDVTERRKIQEALQISEERHRLFFENSQGLMCLHDSEGKILSINSAGSSLLGYTQTELTGKKIHELIPAILHSRITNYLNTINTTGFATGMVKVIHKDGSVKVLYYKNSRLGNNRNAYIIGNAIDFSARIELENDLKRVKVFAERTNQAKDQFLANMSHEIRTPMNAIIGFTDILVNSELNTNQRECVDAIKSAGENLLGIINDILDFSKIQSGKLSIEKLPFNLKETAINTCNILKVKAGEKGIKLNLNIDKNLPDSLIGDSLRINQILLNIIGNAIKFTEQGKVTVAINLIENENDSCLVYFSVKDTGIGIDAEHLESIFERFTQASNETTRRFGGTGLGLSISRNLIQMQGGDLSVNSQPGHGSDFKFQIRFGKQVNAPEFKKASISDLNKSDRVISILLMEDNDLNQKLAKKVVTGFGFKIEVAGNGEHGVEMLSKGGYDLILMDLQMPVMDGYQATRVIREKLKSNIPIIAMTAHSLVGEKEKCLEIGMNDYLSKPFKAPDLLYKINQLTQHKDNYAGYTLRQEAADISFQKNLPNLDMLKELSGGDRAFEKEMLELFVSNSPKDLAIADQAVADKNWQMLKLQCHKLKSSVKLFGFDELSDMLAETEKDENYDKNQEDNWLKVRTTFFDAIHKIKTLIYENYDE